MRLLRWIVVAVVAVVLLLGGGFWLFARTIPEQPVEFTASADGIVVLTGGASRIIDGIELLAARRGQRLLISGVHPSTTLGEFARKNPEHERLFECCVDLGHDALNTVGNAIETARWARRRKFRSLIVVTSGWHMPRALIELERELPHARLIPYPVVTERFREGPWWSDPQTIRVFFIEYVKYMAAYAGIRPEFIESGASLRFGDRREPHR